MTPPVVLPQSLAFWLMAGGLLGVMARAYLTRTQDPFSRETGQDAFLGVMLAVAWVYPLPLVSALYPPFAWPAQWPTWVPGLFFAGFTYLFIEMAKKALMTYAPKVFAKYTGQAAPEEGKKP